MSFIPASDQNSPNSLSTDEELPDEEYFGWNWDEWDDVFSPALWINPHNPIFHSMTLDEFDQWAIHDETEPKLIQVLLRKGT